MGGDGNDWIDGRGNDYLFGGAGSDIFVFSGASGRTASPTRHNGIENDRIDAACILRALVTCKRQLDSGNDVVIQFTFDQISITIVGMHAADLQSNQFMWFNSSPVDDEFVI